MLWHLASCLILFVPAYFLTMLTTNTLCTRHTVGYTLKNDAYIYIFAIIFIGTILTYYFLPDFNDSITQIKPLQIWLTFIFAALIYALFLLEVKFLNILIFVFCILQAFLFIDSNVLPQTNIITPSLQILIIGIILGIITLAFKTLAGLPGIFSSSVSSTLLGVIGISFIGGLPVFVSVIASLIFGCSIGIYQNNAFQTNIRLNEGAFLSLAFILCSILLMGINEFVGSSIFILMAYPLCEFIWAIYMRCFQKRETLSLPENTAYMCAYFKDISIPVLHSFIYKLGILNIFLAAFQLYAPNQFTLPFITLIINLWLLSKLCLADEKQTTFKEANEQFIQDVKTGIKKIKRNNKGSEK